MFYLTTHSTHVILASIIITPIEVVVAVSLVLIVVVVIVVVVVVVVLVVVVVVHWRIQTFHLGGGGGGMKGNCRSFGGRKLIYNKIITHTI